MCALFFSMLDQIPPVLFFCMCMISNPGNKQNWPKASFVYYLGFVYFWFLCHDLQISYH